MVESLFILSFIFFASLLFIGKDIETHRIGHVQFKEFRNLDIDCGYCVIFLLDGNRELIKRINVIPTQDEMDRYKNLNIVTDYIIVQRKNFIGSNEIRDLYYKIEALGIVDHIVISRVS